MWKMFEVCCLKKTGSGCKVLFVHKTIRIIYRLGAQFPFCYFFLLVVALIFSSKINTIKCSENVIFAR